MHLFKAILLVGLLLLTPTLEADPGMGPAELHFIGKGGDAYLFNRRNIRTNPLCYAIQNKKKLTMLIESVQRVDNRKIIVSTKRIIIEPYVFGYTFGGESLLSGNIVEESLYHENVLEYGDKLYEEYTATEVKDVTPTTSQQTPQTKAYLAQFDAFKTKFQKIEVRKVSELGVLVDAPFNGPLIPGGLHTADMRVVVCSIKISS